MKIKLTNEKNEIDKICMAMNRNKKHFDSVFLKAMATLFRN